MKYAENNLSSFTEEEFKRYHKKRVIIPGLFENYKELTEDDIKKILRRLKTNKEKIKKVKDYRDQYLAHNDIKKKDVQINSREINTLLNITRDTIGLMYLKLDFSSNRYSNFNEEPQRDIKRLINDLKKYNKIWIDGINKKYNL